MGAIKDRRSIKQHEIWILLGFILAYGLFYLWPTALNHVQIGDLGKTYSPDIWWPPGTDLYMMLEYAATWGKLHLSPYVGLNLYPPLTAVMFLPLAWLQLVTAYKILILLSLLAFGFVTIYLPLKITPISQMRITWAVMAIVSLTSYGFTFELERGQFNLIAFAAALGAVWLFHYRDRRWRYLAYALFILAVQLKVYPFIFILLLVRDWKNWAGNLRRFVGLAVANLACLYVLGGKIAHDFFGAILAQANDPVVWIGNHSIKAFVTIHGKRDDLFWSGHFFQRYSTLSELTLLGLLMGSLILALRQAYRRNRPGLDPWLLMNCAAAALLIPAVSHDYTLVLLTAPTLIALASGTALKLDGRCHHLRLIGLLLLAFLFISTTVSHDFKSALYNLPVVALFENNLPAIIAMAWIATGFSYLDRPTKVIARDR